MENDNGGLVSYLIPSYNHIKYVKNAIDSVLNQTYKNIELIVCDDCSSDGSIEFLEQYSKDKGFIFIKNTINIGSAKTCQKLMDLAKGEYIGFLASDDWIDSRKVEMQVDALKKSRLDAVYSPVIKYFEETRILEKQDGKEIEKIVNSGKTLEYIYSTGNGAGLMQGGLFKTESARKTNFLNGYKSDDFLFLIRFLQAGYRICYLNEPLCYYRLHVDNSHNNAQYCLNELEIPVIRDFIPPKYQGNLFSNAYVNASEKYLAQFNVWEALKMQLKALRIDFGFKRLRRIIKVDISYLMKRIGIHNLYMRLRYGQKE